MYDPVRDRMIVIGGAGRMDVWTLSMGSGSAWTMHVPAGPPPVPRGMHTAVYDPLRDRVLIFGGYTAGFPDTLVWELSLQGGLAWNALAIPGGVPTSAWSGTAVFDVSRDRVVCFGGTGYSDVWILSLTGSPAWSKLPLAGDSPVARYWHTAIFDPVGDRMLVYGGWDGSHHRNDVWQLSFKGTPSWSELFPPGEIAPQAHSHSAVFDPIRRRMIVFGGSVVGVGYSNEVWSLSLLGTPTWDLLAPAGTPPAGRMAHASIYDPVRDRMLVFGGNDPVLDPFEVTYWSDEYALSLVDPHTWSDISPPTGTAPAARWGHSAIYDPVGDRMVVFGGNGPTTPTWPYFFKRDTAVLSLGSLPAWSASAATGKAPPSRWNHSAIYDPIRNRMLVFGGDSICVLSNTVWACDLGAVPSWSALPASGSPPSARMGHSAIYDPVRDRMLIFGGSDCSVSSNDVWMLTLGASPTWNLLTTTGPPPSPRFFHRAIYDPIRDRMLVFGGNDYVTFNEVWSLSLGGLPQWTMLTPSGTPPPPRWGHSVVYDPTRDRVVVFGGGYGDGRYGDAWALTLDGPATWTRLLPEGMPPIKRQLHTAIYDPIRDRMIVFGGTGSDDDSNDFLNDVWVLKWQSTGSGPRDESLVVERMVLSPPRPNPSVGDTRLEFTLESPGPVIMDVVDLSGRRVRRVGDGWYASGRHEVVWNGRDERGLAVGSGIYFVRVQFEGSQISRRIVRVH